MSELEQKIGYFFKNKEFIYTVTHQTMNKTLAFFGDSALDFVVAEYLYRNYSHLDQGGLTRLKAIVISDNRFNQIAKKHNLEKHLVLKKGATCGPRKRHATFFEAVAGAIYLDGGMEPLRDFVYRMIIDPSEINSFLSNLIKEKVKLNEFCQQNFNGFTPKSYVIHSKGRPHEMTFIVGYTLSSEITKLEDDISGTGTGSSKSEAEELAAKEINLQLKQLGRME
ncbi:ribonuclease III family protein [Methanolapillus ohkumae]